MMMDLLIHFKINNKKMNFKILNEILFFIKSPKIQLINYYIRLKSILNFFLNLTHLYRQNPTLLLIMFNLLIHFY